MSGPGRDRVSLLVPIIAGAAFGAASTALPLGDNDVFWHLATARETLAHGLIRTDLFSWTVAGQPIPTDQWLGQLLWYWAYLAGGWSGILGLRTITVALIAGTVVWTALRERPRNPLVAVGAALPALILLRVVSVERPELFGFLCFALLVALLRSARAASRRALVALPFLIAIWAELHGSFAVGLILVLAMCVEGWIRDDPARRRGYLLVAMAATAATLLTPSGPGVWLGPGSHLTDPPRMIQEEGVPDVTTFPGLVFAVAIILTFGVAALTRRRRPGAVVLLVPVLLLSLTAIRQTPYFVIAAAPFLAGQASETLTAVRARGRTGRVIPPPGRRLDLAAGIIGLVVLAGAVAAGPAGPDLRRYPSATLASLTPGPGLLNDYDWGGFLIWSSPATPVFIDGRLIPYRPTVVGDYVSILEARPGWRELVARRGIREMLVRADAPVSVRARDLGWPVRAVDDAAVLISVPGAP